MCYEHAIESGDIVGAYLVSQLIESLMKDRRHSLLFREGELTVNQKDMFKIETYIVAYYNSWTNEFEHLKPFDNYKEASDYKEARPAMFGMFYWGRLKRAKILVMRV